LYNILCACEPQKDNLDSTMNMANDWWLPRKEELLSVAGKGCPIYVYNEETLNETLFDLLSLDSLDTLFYPVHANPYPRILGKAFELDVGFKCISIDEITRVLGDFPKIVPQRMLFVPNHAHGEDLGRAFDYGAHIAVNNLNILKRWPDIFQDREIFICMDMGHEQGSSGLLETCVRGFYIRPQINLHPLQELNETISFFTETSRHFPAVSTLIFGNSMDLNVNHEKELMDISDLGDYLETIKDTCPQYRLWLELPDFMISHAGVLLTKVIKTGEEEGTRYIRINMDMKGPLYDGLCGASHQIINLSKADDEEIAIMTRIIGLDKGRENTIDFMEAPASAEKDDILLFSNMGAYGPGMDFDEKGRDSVPEHYLHARSMCRVKI
jgi:bifunctional diaminopimelate decarboxylase / aspartate kinase